MTALAVLWAVSGAAWEDQEGVRCRSHSTGQKTVFLSHLYIEKRSFYQDRLGTNIGKAQKGPSFCRAMVDAFADSVRAAQRSAPRFRLAAGEALLIDNLRVSHGREGFEDLNRLLWRVRICETRLSFPHFLMLRKVRKIILPRQARDKHREITQKTVGTVRFSSSGVVLDGWRPRWVATRLAKGQGCTPRLRSLISLLCVSRYSVQIDPFS
jgi:hypothetical protein